MCAGFGRVRDAADLKPLLEQVADGLNARGLIVWLGITSGADLRPVLGARVQRRDARTDCIGRPRRGQCGGGGLSDGDAADREVAPGHRQGALVAPLVGPDGCIGALTAEIRDRQEQSDAMRAFAEIVASQLAGILAAAAADSAAWPDAGHGRDR